MTKTYLAHHGIKGQRWGVRRFQNEDGSLTAVGRKRYDVNSDGTVRLKKSYINRKNIAGAAKVLLGTTMLAKHIPNAVKATKLTKAVGPSEKISKFLKSSVMGTIIGAVVVGAGVKNFIQSNSKKTFNTTGQGPTPETFKGKPKTRAQVLANQKRLKGV